MTVKHSKRPRDPNQLAKLVIDIATGSATDAPTSNKSQMAKMGREGGLKGGPARAISLTSEQRSNIARRAAQKRWAKEK